MYGSLNLQSINLLNSHLLAAFGTHYYLYSTDSQLCLAQFDIGHESPIICSSIVQQKQKYSIRSLDQSGLCIQSALFFQTSGQNSGDKNFRIKAQTKQSILGKKQNKKILSATFVNHDCIFFIKDNKKLDSFSVINSSLSHIAHQLSFSRIINKKQDQYAYLVHQNNNKISIFIKQSLSIVKEYQHTTKITAVTSVEQILIIGDVRGKITLFYQYLNKIKNKKAQYSSVLQWHTGPVKALCSHGQYIYSAGQESVVVLWHTRDLSRDFLPRIGTSIEYLNVKLQSNQIICGLSDNSIKIIDLSQDKQTSAYKTIIDPKGYDTHNGYRFALQLTSYHNGILCLNSLPGKLQFINLDKNGQNVQLQIVPRNIVNSINQDKIQPHRINNFSFSQDWSFLAVSVFTHQNQCYLKFYRRSPQGYQLINRTQNPHNGKIQSCLFSGTKKHPRFITFSKQDNSVKIWSEHKEKKKSIVDTNQVYWRCDSQLKYRNMKVSSVKTYNNLIIVVYEYSQIVLYEIEEDGSIAVVQTLQGHNNIEEIYIIQRQLNKQKKKTTKLLVIKKTRQIQIWNSQSTKSQQNKIQILGRIHPKQKLQYFVCSGQKQIALFFNNSQKTQLIFINKKLGKFTQSYESDTRIQSAFWVQDRLVLLGVDLTLNAIDGKGIIKYTQISSGQENSMEEDIETSINIETDIFKINARWVERQSLKNKKKVNDCVESFEILPSCTSVWEQMAEQLLL